MREEKPMSEIQIGDTVMYTKAELAARGSTTQLTTGVVTDLILSQPRTARVRWETGGISELPCAALEVVASAEAVCNQQYEQRMAEVRSTNYEAPPISASVTRKANANPQEGGLPGLTLQDWQDALAVQDASNLPGVVHSLAKVMPRVVISVVQRHHGGIREWNTHPLVYLWVNKLADLSGQSTLDTGRYGVAYALAKLEAGRCLEWEGAEKAEGKAALITQLYHAWYAADQGR